MFDVVNIVIGFIGEGSVMQWFLFTNMLVAAAPRPAVDEARRAGEFVTGRQPGDRHSCRGNQRVPAGGDYVGAGHS
ncbi:hypothetical protein QWI29_22290 [Mycolicibacterium neoaurum]|uniref:hypothetical protein n=1 Tax=Mycolicibacterium neoaurum TaxID=1795 RepID=UPI0026719303|nr:hypothetical protein [Mycolicibacterium neoaurum]MDO3402780.1 hypothetical protein [Mycolicibacterium neoaurum]